jgi:pyruvate dehydrogenase E2 component (dihydrolipoamide acetyltransferase)
MLHVISVPKWGLSMERAEIRSWLVKEGMAVEAGSGVVELESEKIANEVQVDVTGLLRKILVSEGMQAGVGDALAIVSTGLETDAEVEVYAQQLSAAAVDRPVEAQSGPKRQRVTVGKHQLFYLSLGDLKSTVLPAVLIHGFGGDSTTWQLNAAIWSLQRPIYALDLPGHGSSSRDVGDGSIEMLVEAVAGFTEALEIKRVHLVAHSMGAAVAVRLAQRDPARIASLSLLSPAGLGAAVNPAFIADFTQAAGRKDVRRALETLFADSSLVTADLVEKIQEARRLDGSRLALETIAASVFSINGPLAAFDRTALNAFSSKSLIIYGDKDRVVAFDKWTRPAFDARFEILAGVGHMPQIESAEAVNQLVESHMSAGDS